VSHASLNLSALSASLNAFVVRAFPENYLKSSNTTPSAKLLTSFVAANASPFSPPKNTFGSTNFNLATSTPLHTNNHAHSQSPLSRCTSNVSTHSARAKCSWTRAYTANTRGHTKNSTDVLSRGVIGHLAPAETVRCTSASTAVCALRFVRCVRRRLRTRALCRST